MAKSKPREGNEASWAAYFATKLRDLGWKEAAEAILGDSKVIRKRLPRGVYEKIPGSGDYWIRYADDKGKIRRQHVGKSLAAARDLAEQRRTEVRHGKFDPGSVGKQRRKKMTVGEMFKEKGPEIHQQAKAETHPVELDLEWLAEARRKRPSRILRPERPVFLVETSVLMDRFASADRLFQRARCGEEPWELMFRAVKNIEAWFKEQLPSKNDWAIQSSPKAPEPQISYRLEQYAEVESRLWDMLNVTDALCKDHAVTQEQKALYFKFTKTIKSIGRMHEAMLPGAGSANVICGSPQLYLRMRNYAPNAALSIILQMREDEAQSGNLRG